MTESATLTQGLARGNAASVQAAVIGSGPGGSVVASKLAGAGYDTLVVEEGPLADRHAPFGRLEMERQYRDKGLTVTAGDNLAYVEGCCLGGGSEINSGLYHRPPSAVFAAWSKSHGLPDLDKRSMAQTSASIEKRLGVNTDEPMCERALVLAQGADSLGLEGRQVPKWVVRRSKKRPERKSMTRTYLLDFAKAGGRIRTGAKALSLTREDGSWNLLLALPEGGVQKVRAEHVFLCAGAVQTPLLLRNSGLCQRAGEVVRLHPMVRVIAEFDRPLKSPPGSIGSCQVASQDPKALLGCAASAKAHLGAMLAGNRAGLQRFFDRPQNFAAYYAMTDGGRGALGGRLSPPLRYGMNREDWDRLASGLRLLARILFAADASRIWPVVRGMPPIASADDADFLLQGDVIAGKAKLAAVHLMASCPMGKDDQGVVGPYGEVPGAPGLRIADSSALCGSIGVNPQGTVMALAARNAEHFLSENAAA